MCHLTELLDHSCSCSLSSIMMSRQSSSMSIEGRSDGSDAQHLHINQQPQQINLEPSHYTGTTPAGCIAFAGCSCRLHRQATHLGAYSNAHDRAKQLQRDSRQWKMPALAWH